MLPSSTNFFLVQVNDAPAFRRRLLAKKICVRDCSSFGLPDYIRIGIRTINECRKLVAAIEEIIPRQGTAVDDNPHALKRKAGMQASDCL